MRRLLTIPLSHYCERARWALDHAQLDYAEAQYLQPFARFATRWAGGTNTVPVLQHEDGVLADSTDIVRWVAAKAARPLYPDGPRGADVRALEDELAGEFGDETRRCSYSWFFRSLGYVTPYNSGSVGLAQHTTMRLLVPFVAPIMKRYLDLSPSRVALAFDRVREMMDRIAEQMNDGRPFLFGDTFTAADLTFASLGAICVGPPQYGVAFPDPHGLPDAVGRAWLLEMRDHPAGRFILRLYQDRPAVRATCARPPRVARALPAQG